MTSQLVLDLQVLVATSILLKTIEIGARLSMVLEQTPTSVDAKALEAVLASDPLHELTNTEKLLVWQYRHHLRIHHPSSLPKLLQSVSWHVPEARADALRFA